MSLQLLALPPFGIGWPARCLYPLQACIRTPGAKPTTVDKSNNSIKYRHRDSGSANNAGDQNYTSGRGAESSSSGNRDDNDIPSDNNGGTPVSNSSRSQPPGDTDPKNLQSPQRSSNEPSDPLSLDTLSFTLFSQPFRTRFKFSIPSFSQHFDAQWPLKYITFGPYSPPHLERQARD
ncbi:uncharacterized protein N7473_013188 [Penicillium subrubescens]|uniref:Uncharacterized protein n=1 Tax=Penicillium subrubescens TaxID=1316194 RepID=A0A1Q5ST07_9EURO|nr:uncharacterized protein N7473_013188 [Penicillium subrubescens]KAJ5873629.1 hypothetical protein N7473_013188 [Penicillium subrubescens]OKO91124.1 hypothetical protein PENSUB_13113 [Penicillium subrubescens]